MSNLTGKRVVLGITGGIAAYKAATLVRLLRQAGAEVQVVMTAAAEAFISPLTLQALSGQRVRRELLDPEAEAAMGHIELARWADLVLVAPASADFLARIAHGLANDLLTTLCLATNAPLAVAPAMNQQMWRHPATVHNLDVLRERGVHCWGPANGSQACGEEGPGRMLEPEALSGEVAGFWAPGLLDGVRVLVTAGPTREPIDPVRFIGNRSSGKMGYALAAAMRELGAEVTLVSGPVTLPTPVGVVRVEVETALEMRDAVMSRLEGCELFVATAAVADYRVQEVHSQKLKKQRGTLDLRLVPNPDILAQVAASPNPPFTLGFAAETENVETNALGKLRSKGLDMIAANRVGGGETGFESDLNALILYWPDGSREFPLAPKVQLARSLAVLVAERFRALRRGGG